jgi:hypothetical protein
LGITQNGEDFIDGTIKNISNVVTGADIAAYFYNSKQEVIGTQVIAVNKIET